jgi:hypothetical protein
MGIRGNMAQDGYFWRGKLDKYHVDMIECETGFIMKQYLEEFKAAL